MVSFQEDNNVKSFSLTENWFAFFCFVFFFHFHISSVVYHFLGLVILIR